MTTSVGQATQNKDDRPGEGRAISRLRRLVRLRFTRELLVIIAFCLLTAMMTWPWVLHMRDAVADRGDPYMIAWTLWSDYHQTFHHPLHLFDANVFYPYRYSLAFSENDYGIALLFFPLFAAGMRTLTIHSIATFLGFVFSGYGAFRLTRTLTGDHGPAWVAGIVFAFIPYRFHVLSHLHYLFAGWIPLLFEALVLFARRSSWRRASWLGVAFLMNALSCISWFIMTLIPLALTLILLLTTHRSLLRNRDFWFRGGVALSVATVVLAPFLLPYYLVSVKYGLMWQPWEFAYNSPSLIHWLAAESRNKLWHNFGAQIPGGHKLFPGMLAPLLALAALRIGKKPLHDSEFQIERWLRVALDALVVIAASVAVLALGNGDMIYRAFGHRIIRLNAHSVDHALGVIVVALLLRLGMALRSLTSQVRQLPGWINQARQYLVGTDRFTKESIGVGLILTLCGFFSSLGANVFVNRWLHDYVLPFQSIRIPSRAAMVCYVGLAVLAGVGASRLAGRAHSHINHRGARAIVFALIGMALLFELRASPLRIEKGEVEPSALALRLKQTPMRGGLVELPSEEGLNRHFYMLRAADHGRPLVNATSSFISPLTNEINVQTRGQIPASFFDLLESIPTSYLVVHNDRLPPERRADYEAFLARPLVSGRLRFVNRFGGHDDLYAFVRNEPEAKSEAPLPFELSIHNWAAMIHEDPINLLVPSAAKSQTLYRIYLASSGAMPRYAEFISDSEIIARDVMLGSEDEDQQFQNSLGRFSEDWVRRESFTRSFGGLDAAQYVDRLLENAGVRVDPSLRTALIAALGSGQKTRAGVLLQIVKHPAFVERENDRSLLLLHYFGYLRRNPGESPDSDLTGFDFWLRDLKRNHNPAKLSAAFKDSIEYGQIKDRR